MRLLCKIFFFVNRFSPLPVITIAACKQITYRFGCNIFVILQYCTTLTRISQNFNGYFNTIFSCVFCVSVCLLRYHTRSVFGRIHLLATRNYYTIRSICITTVTHIILHTGTYIIYYGDTRRV